MLFQVPLVVEKLVFLRLYLSIQTQTVLSTSDVEKEEMKWLRYLVSSLNLLLKLMERNSILCRELVLSPTPLTCLSLPERLQFILELL